MIKNKYRIIITAIALLSNAIHAQDSIDFQYFRPAGFKGINKFETTKDSNNTPFTKVKVWVGGDFALQFQGITHSTKSNDSLIALGNNFNLPTANLNLNAQLADGIRMNMVTYLSSRHHNATWVKGGYLQIDKLDFLKKDFLKKCMNVATLKIGMDEINYGDAHFRRSDNARAIYNPFVGNYIMDAFTTEVFSELTLQKYNCLIVAGISNGNLNQTVVKGNKDIQPSVYGKIGFDKQFNEDLRVRLTGSFYLSPSYDNGQFLYSGDRTGSRYYNVMQVNNQPDDFKSGSFSPGFMKYQSFQINPFVKYKWIEFFGIYEVVNGDKSRTETGGSYSQFGAELIFRIGAKEQFFFGGRYNLVSGKENNTASNQQIDRINFGGGWFLANNVMVKAEYVNQSYLNGSWLGTVFYRGNFNGFVLETVIGF